jgi:hypothetical protein
MPITKKANRDWRYNSVVKGLPSMRRPWVPIPVPQEKKDRKQTATHGDENEGWRGKKGSSYTVSANVN